VEPRKPIFRARELTTRLVQRIRNPLNALQLNLDSLEEEIAAAGAEKSLHQLNKIRKTIGELDSVLCEVLRLVDPPAPQLTPVNINVLLREVETFLRSESLRKEVAVTMNFAKRLPDIPGDPVQLKQALLSVLLNAIQACPIEGSVSLATEANNEHIIVRVIDNGEGISPLHRSRIFEPFFSTKEGASGLGLPLALAIVRGGQGKYFLDLFGVETEILIESDVSAESLDR
jgi:signal transduction histidine kinase